MRLRKTTLLLALLALPARAATEPLKPLSQLVEEVYAFLLSDVGDGGIRTLDGDPQAAEVPPYFYHYAIQHDDDLDSATSGYPGWASISYPGYTASIGIDAFLAYWAYSGEPEALARARELADWLIDRRTPASDLYANWVYSTQTDGVMGGGFDGDAVMSDKPGMFGLRCLRLFDVTGDARYLDAARAIADSYVATQLQGGAEDFGRWPFRVRPSDGQVRQDYTSHLIPAIRLLESIDTREPGRGYGDCAQRAWSWLENNPLNPSSANFMHWEGFYEDTVPAQQVGYLEHYSAESTLLALLERNQAGDLAHAIAILDWSTNRYLAPDNAQNGHGFYAPAILEWDLWPNTTYAATGQWAHANLRLHEATLGLPEHDPQWKTRALFALNSLSYGQGTPPQPQDGRMLTTIRELTQPSFGSETWYEQNFNTVIYVLASMGIATELAPADANHLLRVQGGELRNIDYAAEQIELEFAGAGNALFKLVEQPAAVRIDGSWQFSPSSSTPGWSWDATAQLLELRHLGGASELLLADATATPQPAASTRLLAPLPNPARPATVLGFALERDATVELSIFDAAGRRVRSLLAEARPAGSHAVRWDGRDDQGAAAANGVYFVRLRAEHQHSARRILLLR